MGDSTIAPLWHSPQTVIGRQSEAVGLTTRSNWPFLGPRTLVGPPDPTRTHDRLLSRPHSLLIGGTSAISRTSCSGILGSPAVSFIASTSPLRIMPAHGARLTYFKLPSLSGIRISGPSPCVLCLAGSLSQKKKETKSLVVGAFHSKFGV